MLIAKQRNRSTTPLEDIYDLLKKLKARIEFLTFFIGGILSMFSDEEHGIYRETVSAQRQRFPDRRIDLETMFCGKLAAHVFLGDLVRVHRDDLRARRDSLAVGEIAFQDAPDNNVGVGVVTVLRHYGSDGLLLRCKLKRAYAGKSATYEFSPV
jgi:hypothetical protein